MQCLWLQSRLINNKKDSIQVDMHASLKKPSLKTFNLFCIIATKRDGRFTTYELNLACNVHRFLQIMKSCCKECGEFFF